MDKIKRVWGWAVMAYDFMAESWVAHYPRVALGIIIGLGVLAFV